MMGKHRIVIVALAGLAACAPGGNAAAPNASLNEIVAVNAADAVVDAAPPPPGGPQERYDPSAVPGMARVQDRAYVLTAAKWANPNIAVCWESGGFDAERQMVRDAVRASWEANSPVVRFFGWGRCATNAQGIRIAIRDDAKDGPHTKGLGNQLDKKPEGMVLNFTFDKWGQVCASSAAERASCIKSIAVHEFGHALAFAHEQNRADTPGECKKAPQGSNGDVILTPWDKDSVMNYCNPVYNNAGRLSALDVLALKAVYK